MLRSLLLLLTVTTCECLFEALRIKRLLLISFTLFFFLSMSPVSVHPERVWFYIGDPHSDPHADLLLLWLLTKHIGYLCNLDLLAPRNNSGVTLYWIDDTLNNQNYYIPALRSHLPSLRTPATTWYSFRDQCGPCRHSQI